MGNLVADAMWARYPGIDGAFTNSGGLRADLLVNASAGGEAPGQVTWGEMFAVLPFGNQTTIITLTGAQLQTAFLNGFSPFCNPGVDTGRFPQIAGLRVTFSLQRHDARRDRHVEDARRASAGLRPRSARATASASSRTTSCTAAATGTRSSRQGTNVAQTR